MKVLTTGFFEIKDRGYAPGERIEMPETTARKYEKLGHVKILRTHSTGPDQTRRAPNAEREPAP